MAAANRPGGVCAGASPVQVTVAADGGGVVAVTSRAGKKAPRTPTIARAATGPKPERTNARIIVMLVIPRRLGCPVPRCQPAPPGCSYTPGRDGAIRGPVPAIDVVSASLAGSAFAGMA